MSDPFDHNERFERGLEIRRSVVGADYVDKSLAEADAFTAPLQQLITEYCWGEIWGRPGLDRRTRSIVNLAMISALGKPAELALHVRGAIANGLTPDEIMEVLLQVTIYCGVPAGLEATKVARKALGEIGAL